MKRFLFPLLLICLFGSSVSAAEQPAPQVVVSIKPLYSLVAGLMQGVGKPQLLINGGAPRPTATPCALPKPQPWLMPS